MRHLTLMIPIALLITGCSTAMTPPIQEYTIYPSVESSAAHTVHSSKTLRISSMKTIPSLASKNLYYLRSKGESGSYLYSRWSDSPAILIERSLTAALEEKKMFTTLLTPLSTAHADWILEADLNAFYHRFEQNDKSSGVIDITYRLIDTKTKLPLASKRFIIIVASASADAAGGVNALTEATQELTDQLIQWLNIQIQEKK